MLRAFVPFALTLAAGSATADVSYGFLSGDFDRDGVADIAFLNNNSRDPNNVDFFVMNGDGNTPFDPALLVAAGEGIARDDGAGVSVNLAMNDQGMMLLNYGPRNARVTLGIAHVEGAFRVIFMSQSSQDPETSCTLDLLTGEGMAFDGPFGTPFVERSIRALPVEVWKEVDYYLPAGCG